MKRYCEAHSDLDRFHLVCDNMPDEKIMMELEDQRGKVRDEFPVRAMWNAIIVGVVFQHESIGPLVRELSSGPALLEACEFDILPRYKKPRRQS